MQGCLEGNIYKSRLSDSASRGVEYLRKFKAKSGMTSNQIKFFSFQFFSFRSDTKRTKSKRFAFVPKIRGPNQNVLLWSLIFWIKYKCSNLSKTTSRPNQTALFCPYNFWAKTETIFLRENFFFTKSKYFAFVPIVRGPNQNLSLRSISFWTKWKCSTLPKTISRPNQTALLRSRFFGPKQKRSACNKKTFGPNQNVFLSFR